MKAVKEIAEMCNVSKQAVFNQIKAHDIKIAKVKNVAYVVHDEAIETLLNHFNKNHQAEDKALDEVKTETTKKDNAIKQHEQVDKEVVNLISNDKASSSNKELDQLKAEIKLLSSQLDSERQLTSILMKQSEIDNKQIDTKDAQIKQLNNTLDEQQRLLHNQQSLALQSSNRIKELETELKEVRLKLDQSEINKAGELEEVKTVIDDKEVITNPVKENNNISAFWIAYTLFKSSFKSSFKRRRK
ncbi:hypothetical protein [Macrococcus carouselicus]|uniref:DUF536 domain-containing protein n=1 Tax=Macrococcus carouselicus TaxID=69969 RepID=A0A9Q8FJM9_9STAP|nr:hypothetical protein [Macrococcus carouselicus]TDL94264.1 hypothetical protein ERX40_11040 [Macrococcus carouselicus]